MLCFCDVVKEVELLCLFWAVGMAVGYFSSFFFECVKIKEPFLGLYVNA